LNEPRTGPKHKSLSKEDVSAMGMDEFEQRGGSQFDLSNYRSLQKSKKSIKTLEETMKNSRSIEQWLNDFGKLSQSMASGESGSQTPSVTLNPSGKAKILVKKRLKKNPKSKISLNEQDELNLEDSIEMEEDIDEKEEEKSSELIDFLSEINNEDENELKLFLNQLVKSSTKAINSIKLIDTIGNLMKMNSLARVSHLESEMRKHVGEFLVPRSLANSEDIDYLKWLLNDRNFSLSLSQPIIHESICTVDHLNVLNQISYEFLLNAANLNVKLVDSSEESGEVSEDDEEFLEQTAKDEKFYVKFVQASEEFTESTGFQGNLEI
jgi:hypothetical protein